MTPKRLAALNFIKTYIGAHQVSPTVRELRDAMGLSAGSVSAAYQILLGLESEGAIIINRGHARGIIVRAANNCRHCGNPVDSPACHAAASIPVTYSRSA